jgi:hypothetical protein
VFQNFLQIKRGEFLEEVAPPENVDPKWWLTLERVGTWQATFFCGNGGVKRLSNQQKLTNVILFHAISYGLPRLFHWETSSINGDF